ncbi:MAG: hypothetical protein ACK4XK_08060, partial [Casimicrobiaceae bacterium]
MPESEEIALCAEASPAERIELIGFSELDRGRLRLFFERPSATGRRVCVVDTGGDLLVINGFSEVGRAARLDPEERRPRIVIVERCRPDAPYYQVPRDGQLLLSLAQGVNRIRDGWTPPGGWFAPSTADTPSLKQHEAEGAE